MTQMLQVRIADCEKQAEECRIFVGMIPKNFTEDDVRTTTLIYIYNAQMCKTIFGFAWQGKLLVKNKVRTFLLSQ